jgi:hypothetical protein
VEGRAGRKGGAAGDDGPGESITAPRGLLQARFSKTRNFILR